MSRSVSYANGSEVVLYSYLEVGSDDYPDDFAYEDAIEALRYGLKKAFPTMEDCEEWLGREDLAIAENRFVYVGVSEYCGLVSIWVKPKEDDYLPYVGNFAPTYALGLENKLKDVVRGAFGMRLNKVGAFSNGEALFEPAR